MKTRKSRAWVLWYECIGFGLIMVLSWLDELVSLQQWAFGGAPHVRDLRGSVLETAAIVAIWAIVFLLTRRLLSHLHYLETFVKVCAWCRKVGQEGRWVKVEDYFAEGFHVEATHGICPECLAKAKAEATSLGSLQLDSPHAGILAHPEALPELEPLGK